MLNTCLFVDLIQVKPRVKLALLVPFKRKRRRDLTMSTLLPTLFSSGGTAIKYHFFFLMKFIEMIFNRRCSVSSILRTLRSIRQSLFSAKLDNGRYNQKFIKYLFKVEMKYYHWENSKSWSRCWKLKVNNIKQK